MRVTAAFVSFLDQFHYCTGVDTTIRITNRCPADKSYIGIWHICGA